MIRVVATADGNYDNSAQPDDKSAALVVMKPSTTNTTLGGGTLESVAPAGTYGGDPDGKVTFSVGMTYNKSLTNLQSKITLYVPQLDGSIVCIKSNSISSMKVVGTTTKLSTIYTKASNSRGFGSCGTGVDGSVTLRMDVTDVVGSTASDEVGFTVLPRRTATCITQIGGSWNPASGRRRHRSLAGASTSPDSILVESEAGLPRSTTERTRGECQRPPRSFTGLPPWSTGWPSRGR